MTNQKNNSALVLKKMFNGAGIQQKFNDVLGKGASAFTASVMSLVNATPALQEADPMTILGAAMTAATMKLPINPNLGFAYIIPYKNRGRMEAQFQMGWKGFVQLAMRTGQYKTINAGAVCEGQVEDIDFITGEIVRGRKTSNVIIGYVAYFQLINGFSKTLYMSKEDCMKHAQTFSKSYKYGGGVWKTNFDAMATKTVLKQLISKYGIMSIDMQGEALATAIERDQAIIGEDGTLHYADNPRHAAEPTPIDAAAAAAESAAIPPRQDIPQSAPEPQAEEVPIPSEADAPAAYDDGPTF